MPLTVTQISSKKQLRQFVTLVWPIYEGDPHWVPPIIADRLKLLDPAKNPFWSHADRSLFIAYRDGRPVGRIAAIINRTHNEVHNEKMGFFGFFEVERSEETAHALLRTAETWLSERGMTTMRGPVNPSLNDEVGLLVDGFDDPPQILMTYNPEYYIDVIESYGFTKAKDLYAWKLTPAFLTPKLRRVSAAVREREKLTVRNFRFSPKKAFNEDVETLRSIYNAAWEPNWGNVRMSSEEFDALATDLKMVAAKDLVLIVEAEGRPIGFALGLPDINQALIRNRKGSMLGALYHLVKGKKRIRRGRIVVLGVIPAFQRRGIDAVLYQEIGSRMVDDHGYQESEAGWVLEDNTMMNRAAAMMQGEIAKRYRLYDKLMNEN